MTATATITATERQQVLLVPNTALRFAPGAARAEAPAAAASGARSGIVGSLMPRAPGLGGRRGGSTGSGSATAQAPGQRQIWVLRDGHPAAVTVTTGLTDGRVTEVSSDQLQPGMQVITDQRSGVAK
jgi:HlyD family secretion protein